MNVRYIRFSPELSKIQLLYGRKSRLCRAGRAPSVPQKVSRRPARLHWSWSRFRPNGNRIREDTITWCEHCKSLGQELPNYVMSDQPGAVCGSELLLQGSVAPIDISWQWDYPM